jgi:hypothetical protein
VHAAGVASTATATRSVPEPTVTMFPSVSKRYWIVVVARFAILNGTNALDTSVALTGKNAPRPSDRSSTQFQSSAVYCPVASEVVNISAFGLPLSWSQTNVGPETRTTTLRKR